MTGGQPESIAVFGEMGNIVVCKTIDIPPPPKPCNTLALTGRLSENITLAPQPQDSRCRNCVVQRSVTEGNIAAVHGARHITLLMVWLLTSCVMWPCSIDKQNIHQIVHVFNIRFKRAVSIKLLFMFTTR
jgi:hypothetical protein